MERVKGIEPLHPAWKASVLPLNYTRTTPRVTLQYCLKYIEWWRGKDSNFRRPKSTGLQPAPFDRSGTPPLGKCPLFNKASNNMRFIYFIYSNATRDLVGKYTKKRVKLIKIYE